MLRVSVCAWHTTHHALKSQPYSIVEYRKTQYLDSYLSFSLTTLSISLSIGMSILTKLTPCVCVCVFGWWWTYCICQMDISDSIILCSVHSSSYPFWSADFKFGKLWEMDEQERTDVLASVRACVRAKTYLLLMPSSDSRRRGKEARVKKKVNSFLSPSVRREVKGLSELLLLLLLRHFSDILIFGKKNKVNKAQILTTFWA